MKARLRSWFRQKFNERVAQLKADARVLMALQRVVQRSGDVASLETWLIAAVCRLTVTRCAHPLWSRLRRPSGGFAA